MYQKHSEKKTLDDDLAVKTRIGDALAVHPATKDAIIEVINNRGIITLEGEVPDAETRQKAGEIAKNQLGVIAVTNALKIARRNS